MSGNTPFLMKDVVLFAASVYLLKQDVVRVSLRAEREHLKINPFVEILIKALTKIGLMKEDLDYNLLRASMVIIFLFFGYTKWHEYAAQALMPFISNGPLIFWLYPAFGVRDATRFLGASERLIAALLYLGVLEQEIGNPRGSRLNRNLHHDRHDHSIHAERLGCIGRWVSGNGGQRSFPDEGCGSSGGIDLSAEARRIESVPYCRELFEQPWHA